VFSSISKKNDKIIVSSEPLIPKGPSLPKDEKDALDEAKEVKEVNNNEKYI